ncbi:MAG: 50S ribosomal protein L24 [Elusimicrobiales bacterium]|nr:50S ribosomal protein L24 [Elusimicrobiales bacterium]
MKLKKKDTVVILAGKDKGKKGEIKEILPAKHKVTVVGVNIVSKHKKNTKDKPGGIHKVEAPLDISNVRLVCPKCGKAAGVKIVFQGGDKHRACKKCGELII